MIDIPIPETALIGFVLAISFGIFGLIMARDKSNIAFLSMFLIGLTISSEIAGWLPRWVLLLAIACIAMYLSLKWSHIFAGG